MKLVRKQKKKRLKVTKIQAVQGSMLIYKILGGTLKVIIFGFMIVLSGAMRDKIIIVKQKLTR